MVDYNYKNNIILSNFRNKDKANSNRQKIREKKYNYW